MISSDLAGVQEEDTGSTLRQGVSKDGEIRNTPHDGTRTLPPRPDGEQQSTGLQEEEQGQAPASRPGDCIEKGSNPGGESNPGGLVYDTAPLNPFDTKNSNLVQTSHIGQPETNLAPVSRPGEPTLRGLLRSESLNGEPVLRSTGSKDGEIPVKQEEATPASPNMQEGWIISSHVIAVYEGGTNKYGMVRNQPVLRNRTGVETAEENKFFDPGGKQIFFSLLSRSIPLSGMAWTGTKGCTAMVSRLWVA